MSTSQTVQVGNRKMLPVKEVLRFVSYSRDYITRLAREGKIVAVQINRQWLIDPESLQNFYQHSLLEDEVRSAVLRSERKRERDVKDFLTTANNRQRVRRTKVQQTAVVHSVGIMLASLVVGSGLYGLLGGVGIEKITQVALVTLRQHAPLAKEEISLSMTIQEAVVTEQTEAMDVGNGILLMPSATSADITTVFSDPVEVVMVSSTTGVVRLQDGREHTIPFVRVPVSAAEVRSHDTAL